MDRRARRSERLALLPAAQEHILAQEDGKDRLLQAVTELSQAFALAVPHDEALRIRDDVGFFQAVRAVLAKSAPGERKTDEELDHAIRQIVSQGGRLRRGRRHLRRGRPEEAGHLDPVRRVPGRSARHAAAEPRRRAAAEAAEGRDQDARRSATSSRRARSPRCWSRRSARYQNRAIETAQVIEELIELAKDMREANARGEELGLTDDELAFYDALETNDSAVKVLGDDDAAARSPASWSRPCEATSPSTGPCARTSARSCGCSSSASCGSTAIRRTSRKGHADGAGAGGGLVRGLGLKDPRPCSRATPPRCTTRTLECSTRRIS